MERELLKKKLMRKAISYLSRYASSSHKLTVILRRYGTKKLSNSQPNEVNSSIIATVDKCLSLGYLNDSSFATTQAQTYRRLGRSENAIRRKLLEHQIDDETINSALKIADNASNDGELLAALRFSRRRRIGPFSPEEAKKITNKDFSNCADKKHRFERKKRDIAILSRAGFRSDVCLKIVKLTSISFAEEMIVQIETHGFIAD